MNSVAAFSQLQLEHLPPELMELPGAKFVALHDEARTKFMALLDMIDFAADQALATEIELLRRPDVFRGIFAYTFGFVARVPHFEVSRGCDIGCGIGLRTAIAACFGAARITGIDDNAQRIASARSWLGQIKLPGLDFQAINQPQLPVGKGELDWVMMRGVYSGMPPETTDGFFRDCARALKSDGLLLFHGSANPLHGPAVKHIKEHHERMEIGDGTPSAPAGPIYKTRLRIIRGAFGERLNEAQGARLARATCYMAEPEIIKAVKTFLLRRKLPNSIFNSKDATAVPVWPQTGAPALRPTDPFAVRNELRKAGFTVRFRRPFLGSDLAEGELQDFFKNNPAFYITAQKLKSVPTRQRR